MEAKCRFDRLAAFYPPGSLEQIAQRIVQSGALNRLASEWHLPMEIAADLCKLALFDTVLYLDDSGSSKSRYTYVSGPAALKMRPVAFEEGGSRIDDLKLIVSRVAFATGLFDADGIQVRFMNSRVEGNGIRDEQSAQQLVNQVKFTGLTPLGTNLNSKVVEPMVLGPARAGRLQKPVLIICGVFWFYDICL